MVIRPNQTGPPNVVATANSPFEKAKQRDKRLKLFLWGDSGVGKTTLSTHLASYLALQNKKVILVEGIESDESGRRSAHVGSPRQRRPVLGGSHDTPLQAQPVGPGRLLRLLVVHPVFQV